jgi:hypothetical protein
LAAFLPFAGLFFAPAFLPLAGLFLGDLPLFFGDLPLAGLFLGLEAGEAFAGEGGWMGSRERIFSAALAVSFMVRERFRASSSCAGALRLVGLFLGDLPFAGLFLGDLPAFLGDLAAFLGDFLGEAFLGDE